MRHKLLMTLLTVVFALSVFACGKSEDEAPKLIIDPYESSVYSDEDIDSAIQKIVSEFEEGWEGCTLLEIGYAGDEKSLAELAYYQEYGKADQAIVLVSTFEVGSTDSDPSLNPGTIYDNWTWLLVRSEGGPWRHVDHGYS